MHSRLSFNRAQPLALFSYEDLADFAVGLLVGGMLVGNFWRQKSTLLPFWFEYLAS
jgi:hypothetical protein